jgi:Domain of unknown function (DUF4850)
MQRLRKIFLHLLVFLAGTPLIAHAADEAGDVYKFHRPSFKISPEDAPKSKRSGDVILAGGLRIPAYSLSMASGVQEGLETFSPKVRDLKIRVKPELANQIDAYAYPLGVILVPRGWLPRIAREGADGSVYMLFAPDTNGQTYLSFSHSAACLGCAYSSASLYFEEARKLAKENGFPFYQKSNLIRTVTLNNSEKAYSINISSGNPVDGLAYFDADNDYPYYEVEISAPAAQHAIATGILNQFVLSKKSK